MLVGPESHDDVLVVRYKDFHEKLIHNGIRFHQLISRMDKYPGDTLTVNKSIHFEGDNDFWGNVSHFCSIGRYSYCNSNLGYGCEIGRYCSIAPGVSIMGAHHYTDWISTSPIFYREGFHSEGIGDVSDRNRRSRKVIIGNDVWIGANVVLKRNITIGDGAVIASNSVVTKDVPSFSIVGGNPARIIKYRFSQEVINLILRIKWWEFNKDQLKGLSAENPIEFLDSLSKRRNSGNIRVSEKVSFDISFFS